MAAVTRQPFAPLDGARLQNLTSLKNRQNAVPVNSSGKRKASEAVEGDDFENVDPTLFSKRSKGAADNSFFPTKDFVKPSPFVLTKAASTPSFPASMQASRDILRPVKPTQRPRTFLQPKSPAAKINTALAKSSPLSAPAGRSPTRGSKRIGILSRRRTAGPFGRVDPPSFNLGSAAPFSLDAALKGTIPSYSGRASSSALPDVLPEPESKASWFFDIHEDTPEQEMTNLLQHSTCTLDISSDEESELKARRERDEGRNKENMPPVDDVSQTSVHSARDRAAAASVNPDDMVFEKTRGPLGELNAADYYAQGCDDSTVVIVPGDEDGEEQQLVAAATEPAAPIVIAEDPAPALDVAEDFEFAPELKVEVDVNIDVLMGKESDASSKAAVLQPIEGTGESFELWESGSQQDEAEPISAPSPCEVRQDLPVDVEAEGAVAVC
ncbi:hypothetical protein BR93DRAFT_490283 [Coniochaeta sp. PMI_546]|nr:hypothetical protein BR93DRAFT_490283 [Coniochaeta sp. PMI_546]